MGGAAGVPSPVAPEPVDGKIGGGSGEGESGAMDLTESRVGEDRSMRVGKVERAASGGWGPSGWGEEGG